MGAQRIHAKKVMCDMYLLLTENLVPLNFFALQENFYRTVQFMNTEEENNWQKEMTTPTLEMNLVVKLNFDMLKNLHSLQA